MNDRWILTLLVEFGFGLGLAAFLQFVEFGTYLADMETWITVVAGVAGTVLIGELQPEPKTLQRLIEMFTASGIPVIVRSLANNWSRYKSMWRSIKSNGRDAD